MGVFTCGRRKLLVASFGCMLGCRTRPIINEHKAEGNDPEFLAKQTSVMEQPVSILRLVRTAQLSPETMRFPVSLAAADGDVVYVADNNGHQVHRVSLETGHAHPLSISDSVPPRFEWPNHVRLVKDSLYVADQTGIHVIRDGRTQRVIKTFLEMRDLAVSESGTVYALASFRVKDDDAGLVYVLTSEGTRRGVLRDEKVHGEFRRLLELGNLALTRNGVLLAYTHRPLVTVWDDKGMAVAHVHLTHPAFPKLLALDSDRMFTHPRPSTMRLSRYVAGVVTLGKRYIVFLSMPYICGYVYDYTHVLRSIYVWTPEYPILRYFGLSSTRDKDSVVLGVSYADNVAALVELSGFDA